MNVKIIAKKIRNELKALGIKANSLTSSVWTGCGFVEITLIDFPRSVYDIVENITKKYEVDGVTILIHCSFSDEATDAAFADLVAREVLPAYAENSITDNHYISGEHEVLNSPTVVWRYLKGSLHGHPCFLDSWSGS